MQLSDRIGYRMKLHDLHVLIAVSQVGSMSKAAALLNTGQPAISRSIAELEQAIGARLLDRSRQGVTPTAYGRALIDGGTAAFDDLRQAARKIEFLADPTVGEVRVGCNPFLAGSFVTTIVDHLSRRYPGIVFRLLTGYVDELHQQLLDRDVDFLIARRFDIMDDERFTCELLFEESYSVVVGVHSPWARRRRIRLSELMSEPWVLPPPESGLGSVAMEAFRAAGLGPPQIAVIGEPLDVRISLLATGRFVSVVPESVLRFSARRGELRALPVNHSMSRVPVGIFTLKSRTVSPLANLFIDAARATAKQLTKGTRRLRQIG
jgi:DNA-binding transcriptional LysR family regulator